MLMTDGMAVRVTEIRYEAPNVSSFVLRRPDNVALPAFEPGSHVEVQLPNSLRRSYSLSNGARDVGAYRLTVARAAQGAGGSAFLHKDVRVGDVLTVGSPRNNFAPALSAPLSIFVAGGIGITPFVSMITALNAAGRRWRLYYSAKRMDRAPLAAEVQSLASVGFGEIVWHVSDDHGGRRLDLKAVLSHLPAGTHFYCCGPGGMIGDFRSATDALGITADRTHLEYFSNATEASTDGGFTVVLQASGKVVSVRPGETILDAVQAEGIEVPFSCMEGLCGSCETRVIDGVPDHRDVVLSEQQRQEGKTMMICCSGARSSRLVLDL
jgi:tetrachlorobenzoquinone reductase